LPGWESIEPSQRKQWEGARVLPSLGMKSTIVALAVVHGLEHMLHKVTSEHYNYLVFTSVGFADNNNNNNKNNNNKNAADTAKGTWFPARCHLFAPLVSTMLLRTEVWSLLLETAMVTTGVVLHCLRSPSGLSVLACPRSRQQCLSLLLRDCVLTFEGWTGGSRLGSCKASVCFFKYPLCILPLPAVLPERSRSEQIVRTGKQPQIWKNWERYRETERPNLFGISEPRLDGTKKNLIQIDLVQKLAAKDAHCQPCIFLTLRNNPSMGSCAALGPRSRILPLSGAGSAHTYVVSRHH